MQFVGDTRTLSIQAFICICFRQSHNERAFLGHLVYLSSLKMRNLRPRREVTQNYLVGGWQGHLGSCLLCPSQLAVLPTLLVLSCALLASVHQVWAQTESLGRGQMSTSPKERWATSLVLKCAVHVIGIGLMSSARGPRLPVCSQSRPDIQGHVSRPASAAL